MDRELQDWYENFFEMFSTKGWKQLQALLAQEDSKWANSRLIHNEEELFKAHGRLDILAWLMNFEAQHRMAYQDLENEANA